jgi:hypothetical protein
MEGAGGFAGAGAGAGGLAGLCAEAGPAKAPAKASAIKPASGIFQFFKRLPLFIARQPNAWGDS